MTAFGGTANVFVMASPLGRDQRDLSGMGKWLPVGARWPSWSAASSTCSSGSTVRHDGDPGGDRHLQRLHAVPDLKQTSTARPTTSAPRWPCTWTSSSVFQSLLALLGIMGGERTDAPNGASPQKPRAFFVSTIRQPVSTLWRPDGQPQSALSRSTILNPVRCAAHPGPRHA